MLTQRPQFGRPLLLLLSHGRGDQLLLLFGGAATFLLIHHPLVILADVVNTTRSLPSGGQRFSERNLPWGSVRSDQVVLRPSGLVAFL